MALLDISDLSHSYWIDGREIPILKNIHFSVEPGEMVAILGPSGSGKSTLLYVLGCLLQASRGGYKVAGVEIGDLSSDQLADFRNRHIGFVFQQFHLLPRANILENVLLPTHYARQRPLKDPLLHANSLIERVGLSRQVRQFPQQLSGGQQQRVAIARALINNPQLILADEPTGNLDSQSATQILELFKELNREGRTILMITHDPEVAAQCDRVVHIRDGILSGDSRPTRTSQDSSQPGVGKDTSANSNSVSVLEGGGRSSLTQWLKYVATAQANLWRNKLRSFLTMIGVTVGIAAVLSMVTMGAYTRDRILQTYESLGVNKLALRAYPRWNMQARDIKGVTFEGLSSEHDIAPLRRLFPEILRISPVIRDWIKSINYGGRSFTDGRLFGVNSDYFEITNRRLAMGQKISQFHLESRSRVCVIGYEIAKKLFLNTSPLDETLTIENQNDAQFTCRVIGVLRSQQSNNEWMNPDQQILLPETFMTLTASRWNSKATEVNLQVRPGTDLDALSKKIKGYFHQKYGRTIEVRVDADGLLVAQMRRFLNLFTVLLGAISFLSLIVGGIGITNMMLVSVSERIKDIGLRKALGARDSEIRFQFLTESVVLCGFAGLTGLVTGIASYHLLLFLASKAVAKVQFEWIFHPPAMLLSTSCILVVGIASGLIPALRAEKLQVVEALRNE